MSYCWKWYKENVLITYVIWMPVRFWIFWVLLYLIDFFKYQCLMLNWPVSERGHLMWSMYVFQQGLDSVLLERGLLYIKTWLTSNVTLILILLNIQLFHHTVSLTTISCRPLECAKVSDRHPGLRCPVSVSGQQSDHRKCPYLVVF